MVKRKKLEIKTNKTFDDVLWSFVRGWMPSDAKFEDLQKLIDECHRKPNESSNNQNDQ